MTQITGSNEQFLNKEFVIQKIFELMNPDLYFFDFVEKVQSTARGVQFKKEDYSDATDPKKQYPRKRSTTAKFTYVDISPMTIDSAVLSKEGFAIKIDEDALDFSEGVDEIKRAYRKVAYWMAEALNTRFGAALVAGATATSNWAPTAVWSDAGCTPVEDLRKFKYQMKRTGYAYKMTDFLLNDTNLEELEGYVSSIVTNDAKQAAVYGNPVISNNSLQIPIVGNVRGLASSISEGYVLGIDKNNPAATLYYNNSPRHSVDQITYRGADGTWKSVPNFGFNVETIPDPRNQETEIQIWFDSVLVVKEPYALIYGSGI